MTSLRTHSPSTRQHRRHVGYSMIELLIAMGIFAIGFVALAAMFPSAALQQKRTAEDIISNQAGDFAQPIGAVQLDNIYVGSQSLAPLSAAVLTANWTIGNRSFPTSIPNALTRDYFFVPIGRNIDADRNLFVVFIVKPEPGAIYDKPAGVTWANSGDSNGVPGIAKMDVTVKSTKRFNCGPGATDVNKNDLDSNTFPDQVRLGDVVVDSNGTVYNVTGADRNGFDVDTAIVNDRYSGNPPNAIWYAKPPNESRKSAARKVVTFFAKASAYLPPWETFVDNNTPKFTAGILTTVSATTSTRFKWTDADNNGAYNPPPGGTDSVTTNGTVNWIGTAAVDGACEFKVDLPGAGSYDLYIRWEGGSAWTTTVKIEVWDGPSGTGTLLPGSGPGLTIPQTATTTPDVTFGGMGFQKMGGPWTTGTQTMTVRVVKVSPTSGGSNMNIDGIYVKRLGTGP